MGKTTYAVHQQTYKYFWNILVVTWFVHRWLKQFYFCTNKCHVLGVTFIDTVSLLKSDVPEQLKLGF